MKLEVADAGKMFDAADTSREGMLNFHEFACLMGLMEKQAAVPGSLRYAFNVFDKDGSGYTASTHDSYPTQRTGAAAGTGGAASAALQLAHRMPFWHSFSDLLTPAVPARNSKLSVEELMAVLSHPGGNKPFTKDEAREIVERFDVNGDGAHTRSRSIACSERIADAPATQRLTSWAADSATLSHWLGSPAGVTLLLPHADLLVRPPRAQVSSISTSL